MQLLAAWRYTLQTCTTAGHFAHFADQLYFISNSRHAQRVLALDAGDCPGAGCIAHLHRALGAVQAGTVVIARPTHVRALLLGTGVLKGSLRARRPGTW